MVLIAALVFTGVFRWPAARPPLAPQVRRATLALSVVGASRLLHRRGQQISASEPLRHPRLLLTSSGLTTPQLETSFQSMLREATIADRPPRIAMLVTAQMAPSMDSTSKRSPGELRRRRWADARKKGREVEAQLGIAVDCVDCARDADDESVMGPLSSAECIWVLGGNTFFLWHHMRRAGVDELVRRRVQEGVVYVGQSAGSIVARARG